MDFPSKKIMPRYLFVVGILVFIACLVVMRFLYIMSVEREFWMNKKAELTRDSLVLLPKRGDILASDGRILATSLSEYILNFDYMSYEKDSVLRAKDQLRRDTLLEKYVDSIALGMHRLFPDIDVKKYKAHMLEGRRRKSHCWPIYPPHVTSLKLKRKERKNRQLNYLQMSEIRKLPLFKYRSSLNITNVDMRKNPYGKIAFRTIGEFLREPRFGLELTYDSILAGRNGYYHLEKMLNVWKKIVDQEPEDGMDIVTTLDIDVQDVVNSILREELTHLTAHAGVCIVMDVATGDVKAMASLQRNDDGSYTENEPRAVSTHYEPGSVFKPMSFLVAMDDGKLNIHSQTDINGGIYLFGTRRLKDSNYRSGGTVGMRDVKFIIQNSSNVGTARLIDDAYLSHPQDFVDGLYRVGAAENLRIPIDGYLPPHLCSPKDKNRYWSRTDLPWMSIGYVSQLPPINILNFYNGIANNGKLLRPRFVKAVMKNGKVVQEYPVEVLREQMAKPEAVKSIQECLRAVVANGTGKKAGSKYFPVAGKTGTAQIWTGRGRTSDYSVTFVGYFPADNPKYSCIVNIQKAGPAAYGWMSGLVFKRVAELVMAKQNKGDYASARDTTVSSLPVILSGNMKNAGEVLENLNVPYVADFNALDSVPVWGENVSGEQVLLEQETLNQNIVPDVHGYGLRDAIFLLEGMGLKVMAQGFGHVTGQSIKPGTKLVKGATIHLLLEEGKFKRRPYVPKPAVDSLQISVPAVKG